MNENKEQVEFLQWLSTNVEEFADKTPEEIVNTLNELYQTPEGQEQVVNLIKSFKDSKKKNSKFAKGGKLDYLVTKYQNGNPFKVKMNLKIKGQSPLANNIEGDDILSYKSGNEVQDPIRTINDGNGHYYYEDEDGQWKDIDGNVVSVDTPELRKEERELKDKWAKHSSKSRGNTTYIQIVDPSYDRDTTYMKIYGHRKPTTATSSDFGVQVYRAFPKLANIFGYKPTYIKLQEEYNKK